MKKYTILFMLIMIIIIGIGTSVKAESFYAEISGDKVLIRKTSSDGSTELKSIDIYNLENYRYFGIRAMAESCGAEVLWNDSTKTVTIKQNNLAISLKNNSSEIFVNGNKYDFGYPVIIIDSKSYVPLELYKAFTGELELSSAVNPAANNSDYENGSGLAFEVGENSDRIRIIGAATKLKQKFTLSNPERIVLDIAGFTLTGDFGPGRTFDKIRHFIGSDGITRVVFDLKGKFKYQLNIEGEDIVVTISEDGMFESVQELIDFRNNTIVINSGDYSGYSISRGTDPFSLNISFPRKMVESSFEIDGNGELVKRISASVSENETFVKIELNKQAAFELVKSKDSFQIEIYEPVVNGIIYHRSDETEYFTLGDFAGAESIVNIENKNNENIVVINDPEYKLTEGQVYINDENVKSIFVSRDGNKAVIKITTKNARFLKSVLKDGVLNLYLNKNDYSDFLVVISAGHGGSDPGAIVNDIYESRLNLMISEKLKIELENAGVKIYMIRTDDTFVSLDDRTAKANQLKADLFISIHCNALEDNTFDGLMTLVHSGYINYSKINGKTAGTIIHKEVLEATGATDRSVRDRDKIIVLKDTFMPAVEIECGFLTNDAELGKLLDDSYQWSIAKGTAKGVLKVLDLMN